MPITPYSTPIATQYKPLGLEAFAQPLSQMQEKYDVTKQAIEDADFEINRLAKDDERSKELIKTLKEKRDGLAESLMSTKNYRQAAQKLASLNRLYNKDAELTAIRTNYDTFKKADAAEKERVAKGDITQRDYDEWKFKAMNEFKGTNYKKDADTYSSVNTHSRMKNMEDQMREESLKLANMAAEQGIESIIGTVQLDPFTKQQIREKLKYRDVNQVAKEIENFLRTSDKYNDWVKEKADYEWYYNRNSQGGQDFNNRVIQGALQNNDQTIKLISERLKSPSLDAETKKYFQDQLVSLNKQRGELLTNYSKAQQTGNFDELSRKLYVNNAMNTFQNLGYTASDIRDFKDQGISTVQITDDFGKARATEDIKQLKEQIPLTTNIVAQSKDLVVSGGSTSAIDDQNQINAGRNILEYMNQTPAIKVDEIKDFNRTIGTSEEIKTFNNVKDSTKDIIVIQNSLKKQEEQFVKYDTEIAELIRTKNEGTPEEREAKQNKLIQLTQDKAELNALYQGETVPLASIIERDVIGNSAMQTLWEASNKNVKTFLNTLEQKNIDYLKNNSGEISVAEQEAGLQGLIIDTDPRTVDSRLLSPEQEKNRYPAPNYNTLPKPAEVLFSEKLMTNYKNHLAVNLTVAAPEIYMDESASKTTNGASDRLLDYNLNNQGGLSKIQRVSFNSITAETKDNLGKNNFHVEAYNPVPHYAGVDQNGTTVLRYVLKPEYQNSASVNSLAAKAIRSQNPNAYKSDDQVPADVIKAWKENNPVDLYVNVPGVSINLAKEAEVKYTSLGERAIQINDPVGYKTNIQNFATMHLIGDAERREGYLEMAGRLTKALRENQDKGTHGATTIYQAPAAWKTAPDGTSTGYQLTYTVEDGKIFTTVNEVTTKPGVDKPTYTHVSRFELPNDGNIPVQLVAMDLTYGTGREQDLVNSSGGWAGEGAPFVPAFMNPGFFQGGIK
jgi:hypothetical protein